MINNIKIRKANIKDLDDILRLNTDLFKNDFKYDKSLDLEWPISDEAKEYFKDKIIKKDGFVEIVEAGSRAIGYLCGGISERLFYRKEAKYAEIENMFIEDNYRGKGIGTKLVDAFMKWCKENNVDNVAVTASEQNERTINFYRKIGFENHDLTLEIILNEKD